jgi:hypothetical protein
MDPQLRCLRIWSESEGTFDLQNNCTEEIQVTPVECEEPCSETLRIASSDTEQLRFPKDAKNGDQHDFAYASAEQSGTITFTLDLNDCGSEDGGCSTTQARGRSTTIQVGALFAFMLFFGRRLRARRRS